MQFSWRKTVAVLAVPLLFLAGMFSAPYVPNWKPAPPSVLPIELEPQYKASAGYIVRVTAKTSGHSVKWRVISGPDATPSLETVNAHTVDFASPKAGKFVLQASTSVAGESESADTEILNGDGPVPPKPPTPEPPQPNLDSSHVLIVYKASALSSMPKAQAAVLSSTEVRAYLNAHCSPEGKGKAWRVLPDTADVSAESAYWQAAMKRPRAGLPWLIIGDVYSGPLPGTVPDTLAVLQKYAGQ